MPPLARAGARHLRDTSETLPRHLQDTSETLPCRAPDPPVSIETSAAHSEAEGVDGSYVSEGLGWVESEIVKERFRLSLAPNEEAHLELARYFQPAVGTADAVSPRLAPALGLTRPDKNLARASSQRVRGGMSLTAVVPAARILFTRPLLERALGSR